MLEREHRRHVTKKRWHRHCCCEFDNGRSPNETKGHREGQANQPNSHPANGNLQDQHPECFTARPMETTRNDRMDVVECLVDEPRTNAHLTTKTKKGALL